MPRNIHPGFVAKNVGNLAIGANKIAPLADNDNVVLDVDGTGIITSPDRVTITNGTASNSSGTGAMVVTGGMGVGGDLFVGGDISVGGVSGFNGVAIGGTSVGTFTDLTATGTSTFSETVNVAEAITGATGTVVHDTALTNNWVHTSIASNFTVNFTNLATTNNRSYTLNLFLYQGGAAYLGNAVQINGVPESIRWAAYGTPTVNANRFEILTFVIYRVGSTWDVWGNLTSHG